VGAWIEIKIFPVKSMQKINCFMKFL